jgi:hypothetical protein
LNVPSCVNWITTILRAPWNFGISSRLIASRPGLLILALFSPVALLQAQQIPVKHLAGTSHGFLLLRADDGKPLATGDSIQTVQGNRVTSHLTFRFQDGSIDDDITVFSQHRRLRLISDHHLQKGPQFLHPMNVLINAKTGQVTVQTFDHTKDSPIKQSKTYHLDLPPDLSNGLLLSILINLDPEGPPAKVAYLAATPKPRIVHLVLEPRGKDTFSVGGAHHQAVRYVIHTDIGGVEGALAPVVGKQPKDVRVWVVEGPAPSFVRMRGPLFDGGPVWNIEETSPKWPED